MHHNLLGLIENINFLSEQDPFFDGYKRDLALLRRMIRVVTPAALMVGLKGLHNMIDVQSA